MTAGSSIRRARQSLAADDGEADPDVVDSVLAGFSEVFVDVSPSDAVSGPDPLSLSLEDDVPLFTAARRSFFAQPDPLKWIAGGANAFRTGPDPHSGHWSGGASLTPWMTSKRRPHAAQS
jgi:hypothetical protein